MKKRGLIISSIVMMLVVVVALSTATFAWFQVSADAKISTLTVQTASSDGLEIAAIYQDGENMLQSGDMTLSTDRRWLGTTPDYGAELLFQTALSTAYGVTGDGFQANMYTAASRSAQTYATTLIDNDFWFGEEEVDLTNPNQSAYPGYKLIVEDYVQVYNSSAGTALAAGGNFDKGSYIGEISEAYDFFIGAGYYIRTQGFYTVAITESNSVQFDVDDVFYTNQYALEGTEANDGTIFIDGVWQQGEETLWVNIVTAGIGTVYAIVPTSKLVIETEAAASALVTDRVYYTDATLRVLAAKTGFSATGTYTGGNASNNYTDATAGIVGLYYEIPQVTGGTDIETSWTYEANNSALLGADAGSIPRYLTSATPNREYFQLKFALRSQKGMIGTTDRQNIADIFIKKLAVTATGGMAASARIALLEFNDANFTTQTQQISLTPSEHMREPLHYIFVPFASSTDYNKTDKSWANDGLMYENYKIVPASRWIQGSGFAYGFAGETNFTAAFDKADRDAAINPHNWNQEVIKYDTTVIYDSEVWNTATFFNIDKNSDWADKDRYDTAHDTEDAEYTSTKTLCSIGTFSTANSVRYYQLVIWFEGTDTECVIDHAGSGVTVDLQFDFFQRYTGHTGPTNITP